MKDILSSRGVEPELLERLKRIEESIGALASRPAVKKFYTVEEFARIVGRTNFTAREWCRLGRIVASKRACGRGNCREWSISHEELVRFQNEGLLPRKSGTEGGAAD
jgi:hypothetical protein